MDSPVVQRFKNIDPVLRWNAVHVFDTEREVDLGMRCAGEVTIPREYCGFVDLWAVPKCEAYPEGWWVKLTGPDAYNTCEPGGDQFSQLHVLTLSIHGPAEDFTDITEQDKESGADYRGYAQPMCYVSLCHSCMRDAVDLSATSPKPVEVSFLQAPLFFKLGGGNVATPLPVKFCKLDGDDGAIDCKVTTHGNISISDFSDGTILGSDSNHTFHGTYEELNKILANIKVTGKYDESSASTFMAQIDFEFEDQLVEIRVRTNIPSLDKSEAQVLNNHI